jgi:3-phenylpropionate/trans-cinnamate dioxygenase ferredoxin reductase subunit
MPERVDYLIVGGGLAGGYAVNAIRKKDMSGRVVLVTNEKHLPYDRVPLSKAYLMDKVQRDRLFFKKKDFYDQNKVELIQGHNVINLNSENREITLDDDRRISFNRLLLSTGGRARKITLPGADLEGVYYLRTVEDCDKIKETIARSQKVAVIGGGFIGCELAAAFATKGLETTIIEVGPYLLNMAIDEETGIWIGNYYSQKGVNVTTNAAASAFTGDDNHLSAVELKDGRKIPVDFVVVGIGILPNTELAENAGLRVDKGIVANEYLETSESGIYTAGDVARFYSPVFQRYIRVEHYDVAVKHGTIAGGNMAGERNQFDELPYFFSYQFDLKITAYGDLSHRTRIIKRGSLNVGDGFFQFYFNTNKLEAVLAVNKRWDEIKVAKGLILDPGTFPDPTVLSDESKTLEQISSIGK